jgi:hypothetical protein
MATATKSSKSKPETNGTTARTAREAPDQDTDPLGYSKYWEDYYWNLRVEAHETLMPFRERIIEFLRGLEQAGLIGSIKYDVVEWNEETDHSGNWDPDKMEFKFTVTDKNQGKRCMPCVSITLCAEPHS